MDFFTYAMVFVAAFILAVDTGIRQSTDLSDRAPAFMKGPLWGFAPLFLMVLAGLIWMVRAAEYRFTDNQSETATQQTTTASVSAPLPSVASAETQAEEHESPKPSPPPSITLDPQFTYLIDLFHGRTEFQAEALAREHLGETGKVSGIINQVYDNDDGTAAIIFEDSDHDLRVFMYFGKSWSQRLAALKAGDRVTVSGKAISVESDAIYLEDCRIIDIANR